MSACRVVLSRLTYVDVDGTGGYGIEPEAVPWRVDHLFQLEPGPTPHKECSDSLTHGALS